MQTIDAAIYGNIAHHHDQKRQDKTYNKDEGLGAPNDCATKGQGFGSQLSPNFRHGKEHNNYGDSPCADNNDFCKAPVKKRK